MWAQASIGVATNVPVELGVLHQTGALTLWMLSLWFLHSLRFVLAARQAALRAARK